jgi:hypothetical protein
MSADATTGRRECFTDPADLASVIGQPMLLMTKATSETNATKRRSGAKFLLMLDDIARVYVRKSRKSTIHQALPRSQAPLGNANKEAPLPVMTQQPDRAAQAL